MTNISYSKFRHIPTKMITRAIFASMIMGAVATSTAHAGQDKLNLTYDFYSSKLRIMSASFDLSFDANSYLVRSVAATKGLINVFSKKRKMHFGARGTFASQKPSPDEFQTRIEKGNRYRSAHILWHDKNQQEIKAVPAINPAKQASIDSILKPSFPDPLSALLNITFSAKKPCTKDITTFDGRKVFKFVMKYKGKEILRKGEAGTYHGPAHRCTMMNIPLAGYSHKKMKAYRHKPTPAYDIWFAPLKSASTGKIFYIPVKVQGSIDYASVTGVLNGGTYNGRSLSASQQTAQATLPK